MPCDTRSFLALADRVHERSAAWRPLAASTGAFEFRGTTTWVSFNFLFFNNTEQNLIAGFLTMQISIGTYNRIAYPARLDYADLSWAANPGASRAHTPAC